MPYDRKVARSAQDPRAGQDNDFMGRLCGDRSSKGFGVRSLAIDPTNTKAFWARRDKIVNERFA
jgi:hypothetical protein